MALQKGMIYATLLGLLGYVVWIVLFLKTGPLGLFLGILAPFFAYMAAFSYFRQEFVKSMFISFGIFIVVMIVVVILVRNGILAVPGLPE